MNLIFLFRRLVFAQVLLGVVAFCWAATEPGLLLVAGALICLSWYVVEGPTGRPLPRLVINLGSFVAVVWLFVALFGYREEVIRAMGQFTLWLQVVLLYAEKSNRDYGQMMVLSLLQMIAASILSVQFFFGVLLVAYCAVALFSILLLHLKSTSDMVMEKNQTAAPRGVRVSRPPAVICLGYRWQFRLTAVLIGAVCVAVSVVIFLVIPRSHAVNTFAEPLAGATTGFSDRVRLDEPAPLRGSQSPALTLDVTRDGQSGLKFEDSMADGREALLLRGAALDQYDSNSYTWSRSLSSSALDRTIPLGEEGATLMELPPGRSTVQLDITVRHATHQKLFTVPPVVAVGSRNLGQVVFNPNDQQLSMKEPFRGVVSYSMLVAQDPRNILTHQYDGKSSLSPDESDIEPGYAGQRGGGYAINPLEHATRWNVEPERIRQLAQDILEERGIERRGVDAAPSAADRRAVQAFSNWMQQHFSYSLENPVPQPREDPMVQFLFDRRTGHCELFAAGMAALCRSVGIPARVITGYRVSEYNSYGQYYVVRHAHAHAWTEAYLGEQLGWASFDATPPDEVAMEHTSAGDTWRAARHMYEYMEFLWLRNVVAMNKEERATTWRNWNETAQSQTSRQRQWLQRTLDWARQTWEQLNFSTPMLIFAGVIGIFIIIGVVNLIHSAAVRRRRMVTLQLMRLPRAERRHLVKQLRFYLYMLDLLERYGLVRPSWQSPFRFAQDLMAKEPEGFRPVLQLTEQFYEVRFGHRDLDDERREAIREQLTALEKNLVDMKTDVLNAARGKDPA